MQNRTMPPKEGAITVALYAACYINDLSFVADLLVNNKFSNRDLRIALDGAKYGFTVSAAELFTCMEFRNSINVSTRRSLINTESALEHRLKLIKLLLEQMAEITDKAAKLEEIRTQMAVHTLPQTGPTTPQYSARPLQESPLGPSPNISPTVSSPNPAPKNNDNNQSRYHKI